MDNSTLMRLVAHCAGSRHFRGWLEIVIDWGESNEVDVRPHFNGEWCVKIVLKDSLGAFFDFAYPMNRKKIESKDDYAERVRKAIKDECAAIRKYRMANITGRQPAARAA